MKWAGMLVGTIQITRRKPEWYQTKSDCKQDIEKKKKKKKRTLLHGSQNVPRNKHTTKVNS
jgi:hypothetical protein